MIEHLPLKTEGYVKFYPKSPQHFCQTSFLLSPLTPPPASKVRHQKKFPPHPSHFLPPHTHPGLFDPRRDMQR